MSAGRPRPPVRLSKAAFVWSFLNLLTSPFCLAAKGSTDWAQLVAVCNLIILPLTLVTPDEDYLVYAWLLLPGPVFDRVRNDGILSGGRACAGWLQFGCCETSHMHSSMRQHQCCYMRVWLQTHAPAWCPADTLLPDDWSAFRLGFAGALPVRAGVAALLCAPPGLVRLALCTFRKPLIPCCPYTSHLLPSTAVARNCLVCQLDFGFFGGAVAMAARAGGPRATAQAPAAAAS